MNTYRNEQYTITTSLSDNKIYIGITNNISYVCHEGTFDKSVLRVSFNIESIFALMKRCFVAFSENSETGAPNTVKFIHKSATNSLQLEFNCVMEGFLNIEFDVLLREKKTATNEQQLTVEFNRQRNQIERLIQTENELREEIKMQNERMKEMERSMELFAGQLKLQNERIWETLEHAEIVFTTGELQNCNGHDRKISWSYPISSKSVMISRIGDYDTIMFKKLQYFYQLEELILYNFSYDQSICIISCYYDSNPKLKTLKKLTLKLYDQGVKDSIQSYCKRAGIDLIIIIA